MYVFQHSHYIQKLEYEYYEYCVSSISIFILLPA
jgi:hypothetical protein